ncbi:MAG: IS5 family transposase [Gemmataceae bacterium]
MAKPLVSDALWAAIEPLLPAPKPRRFRFPGRKPIDDRKALTGILFVLKTGIPWADLPAEMGCGCGMSCWRRLHAWQQAGVWSQLYQFLLEHLDDTDKIDWSPSIARSPEPSEGWRAAAKTLRIGPSRRQTARLTDANGVPLAAESTAANVPEVKRLLPLLDQCGPLDEEGQPTRLPSEVYGDRAYDSEPHREELRGRGVDPKLAKRGTEHGSGLGVHRWVAERPFSWLHGFRKLRFVTEKTKEMQLAFLNLALSLICLRYL